MLRHVSTTLFVAILATACTTNPTPRALPAADDLRAPQADLPAAGPTGEVGVLVMAHGGDDDWDASVHDAVKPLAERMPLSIAFGMANPSTMQAAVDELESRGVDRIAVVRLFISGESFLHPTEYLLGLREDAPRALPMHRGNPHAIRPLATASTIALDHEGIVEGSEAGRVLADRASALSHEPDTEAVLLLGHGNGDANLNDRLLARMDRAAAPVRDLGFHAVAVETLREDWRDERAVAERRIRSWVEDMAADGRRVIVVPFRLSGFGPYAEVLEGLDYASDGLGLLPHGAISDWLARRTVAVTCDRGWSTPLGCPSIADAASR